MPKTSVEPFFLTPHMPHSLEIARRQVEGVQWKAGEWAVFVLQWHAEDARRSRTGACPRCINEIASYLADAGQPECPVCYGTAWEGLRGIVVRPSVWLDDEEQTINREKRGEIVTQKSKVSTISNFRAKEGDWVGRSDGTWWTVETVSRLDLSTGFSHIERANETIAYNYSVGYLDPATPPYALFGGEVLDPDYPDAVTHIDLPTLASPTDASHHLPSQVDWSSIERGPGPLLPDPM